MSRDLIPGRFCQEDEEPSAYEFDDIDEMDIIEARVKEAMSMERDLAAHLRKLGMEARAVITSFGESPRIRVHDCDLTFDEAAELFRRLSPEWNGQSCKRSWEGLPDDETLERQALPAEEPPPVPEEEPPPMLEEEQDEEEHEKEEPLTADEGPDEKKKLADKRIERRRRRGKAGMLKNGAPKDDTPKDDTPKDDGPEKGESLPPPAPPLAEPPPSEEEPALLLTPREQTVAAQVLAAAQSRGRNANDPAVQRRVIAASIEAMRRKKSTAAK